MSVTWSWRAPELHKHVADVKERVKTNAKLLHLTKCFAEDAKADAKAFEKACAQQRAKDSTVMSLVNRQQREFELTLREQREQVQDLEEHLRTAVAKIQTVHQRCESLYTMSSRCLEHKAEQAQSSVDVRRFPASEVSSDEFGNSDRLRQLEELTEKVDELSKRDDGSGLTAIVDKLRSEVQRNTNNLNNLLSRNADAKRKLDGHEGRLSACERHIVEDDGKFIKLQGFIGMELVNRTREGQYVDARMKTHSLAAILCGMETKMKVQTSALTKLCERQQFAEDQLFKLEDRVGKNESQLEANTKNIEQLTSGMELTREYWNGLSQGFRDSHRTVAIETSMLPAKGTLTGTTLPLLCGDRSRRKPKSIDEGTSPSPSGSRA